MRIRAIISRAIKVATPAAKIVKPSPRAGRLKRILNGRLRRSTNIQVQTDRVFQTMQSRTELFPQPQYAKTVVEHFNRAYSNGSKLAMLEAVVRFQRATPILEIGTAYGMSGITLAMAQESPKFTSIEGFEPMATLGPSHIRDAATGELEFLKGEKTGHLKAMATAGREFDLIFHDGGHNGDAYVEDFSIIEPMLLPESIYMIDDIGWDDGEKRRFTKDASLRLCREGWLELVENRRVEGALLYRGSVGILLVR